MTNFHEEFPGEDSLSRKGTERIQINNVLTAVSVGVIAIVNSLERPVPLLVNIILATSIPVLVTSSLSYSKICYRPKQEYPYWNSLGWWTHTLGYYGIVGAIALLVYQTPARQPAYWLLAVSMLLVIIYSLVDVYSAPKGKSEESSQMNEGIFGTRNSRSARKTEKMIKGLVILLLHILILWAMLCIDARTIPAVA